MAAPVYNPGNYNVLQLLRNEENGQLEKVASFYDSNQRITDEYKAFPETLVDAACLHRAFFYDAFGKEIGRTVAIDTWTQAMEDQATAGITPGPSYPNALSTNFDGINDYITMGNTQNFDIANAFSVSLWVKPDNIAANRILFSKAGPAAAVKGYMLRQNATTGQLFLQMRSTTNRNHTFNTALTAGVWQHIVFTYAGGSNISGASVYKDAVKNVSAPSGALSGTMLVGQDFILGSRNNSFFFSGSMDEVTIWNKELSQAEVTELYNSGVILDPDTHSAAANLTSNYRMGDGDTFPTITDNKGSDDGTMVNMTSGDFTSDVP